MCIFSWKEKCVLDYLSYVKYEDLCATTNPSTSKIKNYSKYLYNYNYIYMLIIQRVLWNRNSVKNWQGVTFFEAFKHALGKFTHLSEGLKIFIGLTKLLLTDRSPRIMQFNPTQNFFYFLLEQGSKNPNTVHNHLSYAASIFFPFLV